jgi:hypothetical protein
MYKHLAQRPIGPPDYHTKYFAHELTKRWSLFEAQDKVDQRREELIAQIEGKLTLKTGRQPLFTVRWSVAGKDV